VPISRSVVGPIPRGRDPEQYDRERRRVLWSMPTGLYVMGSRHGRRRNLMTLSWAMQVATEPKLVAVSVEASALTRELVEGSAAFSLCILARRDRSVARRFVKPVEQDDGGSLNGFAVWEAGTGSPILEAAMAWLDCQVRHMVDVGSHVLFVGEVVSAGWGRGSAGGGGVGGGSPGGPGGRGGDAPGDQEAGEGELEVLRMEDTRMSYGG
jgi:flavin reductase (DIM6/NTAB) family NADH-FMN oxidoreductase RutF